MFPKWWSQVCCCCCYICSCYCLTLAYRVFIGVASRRVPALSTFVYTNISAAHVSSSNKQQWCSIYTYAYLSAHIYKQFMCSYVSMWKEACQHWAFQKHIFLCLRAFFPLFLLFPLWTICGRSLIHFTHLIGRNLKILNSRIKCVNLFVNYGRGKRQWLSTFPPESKSGGSILVKNW